MLNSIGTLIILLCFVASVFGMATFRVNNRIFQYHTQNLFEAEVAPYTARGVLIDAMFIANKTCEISSFSFLAALSTLSSININSIQNAIIAIDEIWAKINGCTTIAHAGFAVSKFSQDLKAISGISIGAALYIPYTNSSTGFGAYHTLPYTTFGFSFYEGASPVNIALLPRDNYQTISNASAKSGTSVIVTVEEESGPWNDIFLSTAYRAFIYGTLFVFIIAIMYSFVILHRLLKTKKTITRQ
ncbi:hypothetical protein BDF19DRAFT_497400, partial [Syncephalis fuscata]